MDESTRNYKELIIDQLDNYIDIQGEDGTWNYDPYMFGMYNGIVLCKSLLTDREPQFKDAPDEWLQDKVDARKQEELHEKYPALKHAYEEYAAIKKLILEGNDE